MTTPVPPYNLSTPDGAVTVGGGSWNYGQTITEETHRAGFELPQPTPDNMLDLLRVALEQLPKDAMGPWAGFLGLAEGFLDAADAAGQIIDALIIKPVVQTVEAFGLWVAEFFEGFAPGLGTSINAFIDWFNGNVMSPLATWISNVQTFLADLLGTPEQVIGNIFNVVADGIQTVGDFFTGLWNTLTGNNFQEAKISQVNSALGMLNSTSNTAASNAVTAQVMADVAGQTADVAFTQATIGNNLVRSKIAAGDNFATNPGFDQEDMFLGSPNVTRSDFSPRTGTHSARVVTINGQYSFVYPVAVNDGHLRVPCSSEDVFYFEYWCKGLSSNQPTTSSMWLQSNVVRADQPSTNVAAGFGALNASHNDQYSIVYGTMTIPEGAYGATFYLVFPDDLPTGNTYFIDDIRLLRVTEAEAAKLMANTAQAQANTATTNAEVADGKADSALGMLGELIQNLLEAPAMVIGSLFNAVIDGIQTVGEWLGGLWSAFLGVVNPGPKTSVEVNQAAASVKADTDTNAANVVVAQSAAAVADSKAVSAQSTANTGVSNAALAAAAASAADDKAVNADSKAVAAQNSADEANAAVVQAQSELYTVIASGANICNNPEAELDLLSGEKRSTDYARTGTYSAKIVSGGSGATYYSGWLADSTKVLRAQCTQGDWFYIEYWVRAANGNVGGGTVSVFLRQFDGEGNNLGGNRGVACNNDASIKGDFHKQSGIVQLEKAGVAAFELTSITNPDVPQGDTVYIDSVKLIRVTEAYNALLDAGTAQNRADLAYTNAGTADGKAVLAQLALRDAFANGVNMIFDGGFENDYLQVPTPGNRTGARSSEQARTGSYSWKNVMSGSTESIRMDYLSDRTTNANWPTSEDRRYYYEAWVYPKSTNSHANGWISLHSAAYTESGSAVTYRNIPFDTDTLIKGQWNKLSGIISFDGYPTVAKWHAYIRMDGSCTPGDVFYWDDVKVVDVSEAYEADLKALSAQSLIDARAKSGNNMIISPDFEDSSIERERYLGRTNCTITYDTSQKHSGTKSLKITVLSPDWNAIYLSPGKPQNWLHTVRPGDIIYASVWVKPGANNDDTGYFRLWMRYYDEVGGSYQDVGNATITNTTLNNDGGWQLLETLSVVPEGKTILECFTGASNSSPAGNVYWVDDAVLRVVTEAKNAHDAADLAQGRADTAYSNAATADSNAELVRDSVNLKSQDFTNLVAGSDFDGEVTGWRLGESFAIATDRKRSGEKSLKITARGGSATYVGTSNPDDPAMEVEVKPGDQFLMELWAMRTTNYSNTDGNPRFRLLRPTGATISNIYLQSDRFPNSYTWYKFTTISTIPDDGTTRVRFAFTAPPDGTPGSIWVDDIVVRRITRPSEVQGLPTDISVEETLIQHSADISELKATREVTVNKGKTINVNFTTLANASSLPASGSQRWTTTYSGSGSSTFGIVSGKAAWTGSSGSREAKVIYNGDGSTASATTLTDYQTIRGVLVNPPINQAFTAIARANSTNPNTYVWAEAVATTGFFSVNVTGKIGAVVNGTNIDWVTGIPLTWSTEMTFKCGVDGDPRRYQVFSGNTLVLDYVEDTRTIIYSTGGSQVRPSGAALSSLGSSFRRWGAITRYDNIFNSGTVSSVTVSDDPPVVYAGSVARMSRSTTAGVGDISTTLRALPTSFFDGTPDFESLDIDADTVNGRFYVSKAGMYAVAARIQLTTATDANAYLGLQVNNSTKQYGPTTWCADTGAGAIGPNSGFALFGSWLQYMEAGDHCRLVYKQDRNSRSNILTGGDSGRITYFTISGLG